MSEDSPLHLVLGDEELLVERAIADVLRSARQRAGQPSSADIPVNRMRAGDVSAYELAELLSPSLFADERVVVLEAAGGIEVLNSRGDHLDERARLLPVQHSHHAGRILSVR